MLDERSAVEQARRGEERAWRELYDAHVDLVFRLAAGVVKDRDAALDIVQESFIKASGSIDRFRGDSSFRSWIASIALNEARSWLRRRARATRVALDRVPEIPDGRRGADERVAAADLAGRALELVETLPEQQRDAVLLRVREGLSYREIAELLDTSEGSARVSYHHGIRKLRARMGPLLPEEAVVASAADAAEVRRTRAARGSVLTDIADAAAAPPEDNEGRRG